MSYFVVKTYAILYAIICSTLLNWVYPSAFEAYENEEAIEQLLASLPFREDENNNIFCGAIIFNMGGAGLDISRNISYKIRLVDVFEDTSRLFPIFQFSGPNYGTYI